MERSPLPLPSICNCFSPAVSLVYMPGNTHAGYILLYPHAGKDGRHKPRKQVTLTNPVFLHVPSKAEIVMWTIGIIVH